MKSSQAQKFHLTYWLYVRAERLAKSPKDWLMMLLHR
jgi:hypothetical protein